MKDLFALGFRDLGTDLQIVYTRSNSFWFLFIKSQFTTTTEAYILPIIFSLYFILLMLSIAGFIVYLMLHVVLL